MAFFFRLFLNESQRKEKNLVHTRKESKILLCVCVSASDVLLKLLSLQVKLNMNEPTKKGQWKRL